MNFIEALRQLEEDKVFIQRSTFNIDEYIGKDDRGLFRRNGVHFSITSDHLLREEDYLASDWRVVSIQLLHRLGYIQDLNLEIKAELVCKEIREKGLR